MEFLAFVFCVVGLLATVFGGLSRLGGNYEDSAPLELVVGAAVMTSACLLFLVPRHYVREEHAQKVRDWEKRNHIQACVDSPKNIAVRSRWCSDEGWKHVRLGRHDNPYQVCIGQMVEGQRADCERAAGGRPTSPLDNR